MPAVHKRYSEWTRTSVIRSYQADVPVRELCRRYGVGLTTIWRWLRQEGVAANRYPRRAKRRARPDDPAPVKIPPLTSNPTSPNYTPWPDDLPFEDGFSDEGWVYSQDGRLLGYLKDGRVEPFTVGPDGRARRH